MMTRRSVLKAGVAAAQFLRSGLAASHDQFWNSKDPGEWTEKETTQIISRSPWAKQAVVDFRMGQDMGGPDGAAGGQGGGRGSGGPPGGGGPGGGGGMGGPPGGGGGMGGPPGGGMGGPGGGDTPNIHALVRWESALPICAALKKSVPPEASQFYLISVTGLPMRPPNTAAEKDDRTGRVPDMMKQSTSLERKGKDPIPPDHIEIVEEAEGSSLRFSFPRDSKPILVEDKEVTFVTRMGPISVKAKFPLREMLYKSQLAL